MRFHQAAWVLPREFRTSVIAAAASATVGVG
jgi:hypothetical protein